MIKIAYTIGTLLTGGAEVFVTNLIKKLDKTKFEAILIVLDQKNNTHLEEQLEKLGIRIYYVSKPIGFSFKSMLKIYKILNEFNPSIIHGNIGGILYVLLYLLFHKNVVAVHTAHTLAKYEFGKFKRIVLKYFYKRKRIIPVVISKSNLEEFIQTYKISNHLVEVICNGIDVERYYTKRKFNDKVIKLGHVGRFEEVKNHITIFMIYEKLIALGYDVSVRLVGEGSLYDYYKELYRNQHIEFVGFIEAVENELKKIDFFVFPSIYEGLPLSLIEAMASGCVIVASDVGGIKDLIEDDVNGYKFPYNDVDLFVKQIEKLSLNVNKMQEISNNNINKSKLFSVNLMVRKYEDLYIKEVSRC